SARPSARTPHTLEYHGRCARVRASARSALERHAERGERVSASVFECVCVYFCSKRSPSKSVCVCTFAANAHRARVCVCVLLQQMLTERECVCVYFCSNCSPSESVCVC